MDLQIDRLKIWEKYLRDSVNPERFNMKAWWQPLPYEKHGNCNSVACALGWACTIPELNDVGLKLNHVARPMFTDPDGSRHYDEAAAIACFGLNPYDACSLVFAENYPARWGTTAVMVADRISEIIRDHQP